MLADSFEDQPNIFQVTLGDCGQGLDTIVPEDHSKVTLARIDVGFVQVHPFQGAVIQAEVSRLPQSFDHLPSDLAGIHDEGASAFSSLGHSFHKCFIAATAHSKGVDFAFYLGCLLSRQLNYFVPIVDLAISQHENLFLIALGAKFVQRLLQGLIDLCAAIVSLEGSHHLPYLLQVLIGVFIPCRVIRMTLVVRPKANDLEAGPRREGLNEQLKCFRCHLDARAFHGATPIHNEDEEGWLFLQLYYFLGLRNLIIDYLQLLTRIILDEAW
eukprot:CAMPEP_0170543798 /NCGR_PEP_ID=MMETSP0211-20121228/2789_1 /TAXON_ID=311385 /ORGANISM="Pseudokeronopsis sp., Strain OXSARD2" /LENGTH=269 /DNA_ID=CAMNT_0010847269 /DNA_START=1102 /DNA_END=1908 /DNA_ORIENTATION=+